MSPPQLTEDIKTNYVLIYNEFHILEKRPLSQFWKNIQAY